MVTTVPQIGGKWAAPRLFIAHFISSVSGVPGSGLIRASDLSVHAIRRRAGRRRPFEVRWQAAGRSRSKSFITNKLADSYRAELVRAARMGLDFDPLTGESTEWNLPEPAIVTWHEEATAYAVMKWPSLAAVAWTSTGTSHEPHGLKHRPDGTIRMIPAPPVLVAMLHAHHAALSSWLNAGRDPA
jgi:hypothetical protein